MSGDCAGRWSMRCDVEELLAERGLEVDHVTLYRWVQRFAPLFANAGRPLRRTKPGDIGSSRPN